MKYLYSDEEECKNNDIIKKWIQLYGEKESFKFKRSADVNLVNYNETYGNLHARYFRIQNILLHHISIFHYVALVYRCIFEIQKAPGYMNKLKGMDWIYIV